MMTNSKNKKHDALNFELNLMPVFDIMSVCICFLLMTVAWIHIGSMDVSQAMGGQAASEQDQQPAVWAYLNKGGEVVLSLRNVNAKTSGRDMVFPGGRNNTIQWNIVETRIESLHQQIPELKVALIMPSANIPYDSVIGLMDQFKKHGMTDIGLSPL